jgi:hypothetical protein
MIGTAPEVRMGTAAEVLRIDTASRRGGTTDRYTQPPRYHSRQGTTDRYSQPQRYESIQPMSQWSGHRGPDRYSCQGPGRYSRRRGPDRHTDAAKVRIDTQTPPRSGSIQLPRYDTATKIWIDTAAKVVQINTATQGTDQYSRRDSHC